MELQDFPEEIISHIIAYLNNQSGLLQARLVCRQWSNLATKRAFHTIKLIPDKDGFELWHQLMNNNKVRSAARRVVINSRADDDEYGDYETLWDEVESERREEEGGSQRPEPISQIVNLPKIDEIHLHFSDHCEGVANDGKDYSDDIENIECRKYLLTHLFEAINERGSKPDRTKIRSLTIENLQNIPLPDFTSSELFKSVTKDIDELHLRVAEEYNEAGPDHDVYCMELFQFEPYMQSQWLSPLAEQLTSLTLYFNECWGTMPGTFNGHGLVFPHLKTLKLGYFVISHNDHLDWVTAQSSLSSLRLDNCYVLSYLRSEFTWMDKWNTPTHDWETLVPESLGHASGDDATYYFPGTWEFFFDKIRTGLPRLTDFQFNHDYYSPGERFNDPNPLPTSLSTERYIVFNIGICPSRWGTYKGGQDHFAGNDTIIHDRNEETEEGDNRALEALLKATVERRQ